MTTEVTNENLWEIEELLEAAVHGFDGVVAVVGVRCQICGKRADITDLYEFVNEASYIPPDPFPLGTPVVDTRFPSAGVVVRSEVISPGDAHTPTYSRSTNH